MLLNKKCIIISSFITFITLFNLVESNFCIVRAQVIRKNDPIFYQKKSGAKQVAMAEAFTGLADDINLMRYNIGGLGYLPRTILSLNYYKWVDDTQQGGLGLALPTRYGIVGIDLNYFYEVKSSLVDQSLISEKFYKNNDLAFSIGYGRSLKKLSLGAGLNFLHQNIIHESTTALSFDLGILYRTKYLSFGTTVQNIAISKFKFSYYKESLPEIYRAGIGGHFPVVENLKINMDVDFAYMRNNSARFCSGAEFVIRDVLAIRGGYKFHNFEENRWAVGLGLMVPMDWLFNSLTRFDYAFSPLGISGRSTHRFSLVFDFGQKSAAQQLAGMTPQYQKEIAKLKEQLKKEVDAAEKARLSAEEAERRANELEDEMTKRFKRVQEIKSSGGKLELVTKSPESDIPNFPWPPPKASAFDIIPPKLLTKENKDGKTTLKDIGTKLSNALSDTGYTEITWYEVPNGFALVTHLEQIDFNGKPKPNRWAKEFSIVSLKDYFSVFLKGNRGLYRIIVIIVTTYPIFQDERIVSRQEAEDWLHKGAINIIPNSELEYTNNHSCVALIYEFENTELEQEIKAKIENNLTGKMHLEGSGILTALEKL